MQQKTYNTRDSPVVTDLSTSPALSSLTMGERTGSRIVWKVWSYVLIPYVRLHYEPLGRVCG
ncbi:hypothetical protein CTRU02_207092 [Colletotrichum truncatum]|uniref:Uncharacterized protein n=1 Tax=Colletotrichum truncatum TaxID=5467 RepID=A0ACC3YZV4_COLTU